MALLISYCLDSQIPIPNFVGILKGRTAIRVFSKFKKLKENLHWGNKFWSRGYCVDTVGLDSEMIRKYVKHQERKEKQTEQEDLFSKNPKYYFSDLKNRRKTGKAMTSH